MSGCIDPTVKGDSNKDIDIFISEDASVLKLKLSPCSYGLKIRPSLRRFKMLANSSNDRDILCLLTLK